MNRRDFLRMGAAAALGSVLGTRARAADKKRPNVLVFFTDDQRFDTVRALGNSEIVTPTMDRLVREGVAFTHASIMGGNTGAVCVPSRAMLLSGRGLFRIANNLDDGVPLWPEVFRQAGYVTFGTGKWHNRQASYARCFTTGDKIFFGGMSDHDAVPVHDFDPTGKYPKTAQYVAKEFSSELFSDAAIRFLRAHKGDPPFFAYVSYTAPHDPRTPPQKYKDMYDPAKIALPPNFLPKHLFDNGEMEIRDEKLLPWPRTPEAVRGEIATYYGMITHLDEQMGRVISALEETGHARNTIVVFVGDNGLAVGQHGLLGKQNVYEHSLRVPLVICAPGVGTPGSRSAAFVYPFDLFPTVCELAGLAIPETVEGKSLVPALKDPSLKVRDTLFGAYRDLQRMVRTDRWKLIWYPKLGKVQLFDLADDPWEMKDLSDRPEHAAVLARMKALLAEEQKKAGDTLRLPA